MLKPSGAARIAFLYRTLRALDADLRQHGGQLVIRRGDPVNAVPKLVKEVDAAAVHISADFGPYGSKRDDAVEDALGDVPLTRTGSPYAVTPGRVTKDDGGVYKVYTPYYRTWKRHGWHSPATAIAGRVDWMSGLDSIDIPNDPRAARGPRAPRGG